MGQKWLLKLSIVDVGALPIKGRKCRLRLTNLIVIIRPCTNKVAISCAIGVWMCKFQVLCWGQSTCWEIIVCARLRKLCLGKSWILGLDWLWLKSLKLWSLLNLDVYLRFVKLVIKIRLLRILVIFKFSMICLYFSFNLLVWRLRFHSYYNFNLCFFFSLY